MGVSATMTASIRPGVSVGAGVSVGSGVDVNSGVNVTVDVNVGSGVRVNVAVGVMDGVNVKAGVSVGSSTLNSAECGFSTVAVPVGSFWTLRMEATTGLRNADQPATMAMARQANPASKTM